MAYSKTTIANLAAALLEAPAFSNVETEDTPAADTFRSVWEAALDMALASYPWGFAIGRWNNRAPVPVSRHPAPETWDNAFEIPADCVRVLQVNPRKDNKGDVFKREDVYIMGDFATANIRGIRRVKEPGKYSIWFVQAFSTYLAALCSKEFNASEEIRANITKARNEALANARSTDGSEGTPDPIFKSTWLAARDGDGLDDEGY